MNIGGFHPISLIDYPGKLAAVIFFQGCNFRCGYCHNPELLSNMASATSWDDATVLSTLKTNAAILDGVVLSGGEPTLQQDLPAFCRTVKAMGLSVKLDTNGSRPGMLKRLLDRSLVDYVAMDLKAPLDEYADLCGANAEPELIEASIELLLESACPHEFRTTLIEPLHTGNSIGSMTQLICGAQQYYLQTFQPVNAMCPEFNAYSPWTTSRLNETAHALCDEGIKTLVR